MDQDASGSSPRPNAPEIPIPRYRIHWHVFLTHFPISFFMAAFGFQVLHLFVFHICFEVATNAALIAGTVMLLPTTLTGWQTWKVAFRGTKNLIFRRKIGYAGALLAVSFPMTVWRVIFLNAFEEIPFRHWHWAYFAGNAFLIFGALAEGFFGSRLHHR